MSKLDQLAILGKPYDHEDQVEQLLDGLPDDYKMVIDQIKGKDTPPSITEVHERLLNHEAKLLANHSASFVVIPTSANAVQHRPQNSYNRAYNNKKNNNFFSNDTYQTQPQHRPEQRVYKPYLGKCQLCHTQGHSARRCPQFQGQQQQTGQTNASPFKPWQPRANVAVTSPYTATNWLMDSGATHHITSDLNNLSLHTPYQGSDDVLIADGSSLPITHTGSSIFSTPTRNLSLHKILCVPNVDKNLISVYRLCNTNGVSVEFFLASFQVKDLSTGVPLLQGKTRNELYEWPVSPLHAKALITSSNPKTSLSSWHSRLGHLSFSILNTIVSRFLFLHVLLLKLLYLVLNV